MTHGESNIKNIIGGITSTGKVSYTHTILPHVSSPQTSVTVPQHTALLW
jgi:hypothetical protein